MSSRDPGPPPGYTTAGTTIVAPLDELLELDEPLPPQAAQTMAPPPPPLQPAPEPVPMPSSRALPWWAYMLFGFVAAWLVAGALSAVAVAIAVLVYMAP